MTVIQIAQDLLVQTLEVPPTSGNYVGVECSHPVAMPARAVVTISVVLQRATGAEFELAAWVQGSNDLSTWHTMDAPVLFAAGDPLPRTEAIGGAGGAIVVPYAFGRVMWVLYPPSGSPPLDAGQTVLLSAVLSAVTEAAA